MNFFIAKSVICRCCPLLLHVQYQMLPAVDSTPGCTLLTFLSYSRPWKIWGSKTGFHSVLRLCLFHDVWHKDIHCWLLTGVISLHRFESRKRKCWTENSLDWTLATSYISSLRWLIPKRVPELVHRKIAAGQPVSVYRNPALADICWLGDKVSSHFHLFPRLFFIFDEILIKLPTFS